MRVSAKIEYACLAMMGLAAKESSAEPLRTGDLAERYGIPARFLVQILLQLKAAGLVSSTRGSSGGYQLARPADEITLADVLAVIEGAEPDPAGAMPPRSGELRALRGAWDEVEAAQREILSSITLAELAQRARGRNENMYYI